MKKLLSLVSMTAFIVGGSVGSAAAMDEDTNKVVESVNTAWNTEFNRGDSQALAELYYEDATLSPGNGEVLVGPSAIAGLFQSFFDNGVTNHTIETIQTYRNGNQIVQLGKWQAEGVNEKQESISFGGILITVIEQNESGEWKTHSHVWNMSN